MLEQRANLDGNETDDRMHSSNPGSPDIFGRPAGSKNTGFYCEYYWLDHKFRGTLLRMRVGFDLWRVDQAGLLGDNDARFALFGDFGNVDVMGAAVVKRASQCLGLTNDNDCISYTFSGGYTLKPHRFQLDMAYFRARFSGADTQSAPSRPGLGFRGQKTDSVLIIGSWSGRLGPVWGAEALPLLEQAIEQAIATKFMGLQARRVAWLSEAYLLTGRRDEALRLAQRALELAGLHKERGHEAWALRLLGEIASQGSPPEVESATASYRQAMALAEEFGMHPLLAHCHLGGGMLYARIDHREGARTHLSKALALYCTLEMTFWLPQVEGVLVQMEKR